MGYFIGKVNLGMYQREQVFLRASSAYSNDRQ